MMQERKIYVFGGWDTPVCYNDMYMLDLGERSHHRKTNAWLFGLAKFFLSLTIKQVLVEFVYLGAVKLTLCISVTQLEDPYFV